MVLLSSHGMNIDTKPVLAVWVAPTQTFFKGDDACFPDRGVGFLWFLNAVHRYDLA
jgi:hypothetical protein